MSVEAALKKATPRNAVSVGYTAHKDGVIFHSPYGDILIPASKMEEMHAAMCRQIHHHQDKRADGTEVIYRGKSQ